MSKISEEHRIHHLLGEPGPLATSVALTAVVLMVIIGTIWGVNVIAVEPLRRELDRAADLRMEAIDENREFYEQRFDDLEALMLEYLEREHS